MLDPQSGSYKILNEARDQLQRRADRLEALVAEHAEVRKSIAALDKALGHTPTSKARQIGPAGNPGAKGGDSPRARFTAKLVALVADGERSIESIAAHFGANIDFTRSAIEKAAERGQLRLDGQTVSAVPA